MTKTPGVGETVGLGEMPAIVDSGADAVAPGTTVGEGIEAMTGALLVRI